MMIKQGHTIWDILNLVDPIQRYIPLTYPLIEDGLLQFSHLQAVFDEGYRGEGAGHSGEGEEGLGSAIALDWGSCRIVVIALCVLLARDTRGDSA